jgi:serine/threonine-protein kinase mTOR
MRRMVDKLEGRDFRFEGLSHGAISVSEQVSRLIQKATNNELLCQSYIGWCPFW